MILRATLLVALFLSSVPARAAIPTISRDEIISIAKTGVGCPYVWGGTCWDPDDKSWKGPDCSGYVTKCWQIPSESQTTDCVSHIYTTYTYRYDTGHWTNISRDDLLQGDALVYNTNGAGHIVIYDSGDKWGTAQVYEARGSAYGVVYREKDVDSSYVARRRNSIVEPPTPTYPLLTITTQIAAISQQDKDFCAQGTSAGIFDWFSGQETGVSVDVKNSGTTLAQNVTIGLWAEEPYVQVSKWNIYSDKTGSFLLNDTDSMQTIPHDSPGKSFTLNLGSLSLGETKRIMLRIKALKYSIDEVDHPDIRAWIAHVDGFYDKQGFDTPPNNVDNHQQQNGGDLKAFAQSDVFANERCDGKDNNCDGMVDEGNVCNSAGDQDSGPYPATDAGIPPVQGDSGPTFEDGGTPPAWTQPSSHLLEGGCSLNRAAQQGYESFGVLLFALGLLALTRPARRYLWNLLARLGKRS